MNETTVKEISLLLEYGYQRAWQVNTNSRFANKAVLSLSSSLGFIRDGYTNTEEYKKEMSLKVKEYWNNHPEEKLKVSKRNKKLWDNTEYRKACLSGFETFRNSPEYKEVASRMAKISWMDEDRRKHQSEISKKRWCDADERTRKSMIAHTKTEKFKKARSDFMAEFWSDTENREKHSKKLKENYKNNPEKSSRFKSQILEYHKNNKERVCIVNKLSGVRGKIKRCLDFINEGRPAPKRYKIKSTEDAHNLVQRLFREEVQLKTQLEKLDNQNKTSG